MKVCRCENLWGITSGIGLEVFIPDLGCVIMVLNIYGPYNGQVIFWDKVFSNPQFDGRELILGVISTSLWGRRRCGDYGLYLMFCQIIS